jgi:hypothetical protein
MNICVFLPSCKTEARFGRLPSPWAARTVLGGLIWLFSLAFGRTAPVGRSCLTVCGTRCACASEVAILFIVLAVILPAKADVIVVDFEEATVGDGDALGVAGEIGENLRRSGERALGVDHPLALA